MSKWTIEKMVRP